MSGLAYLCWTDTTGTRQRVNTPLPVASVAGIVDALKQDFPNTTHVVVLEEEIETWMAES